MDRESHVKTGDVLLVDFNGCRSYYLVVCVGLREFQFVDWNYCNRFVDEKIKLKSHERLTVGRVEDYFDKHMPAKVVEIRTRREVALEQLG